MKNVIILLLITLFLSSCGAESENKAVSFDMPKLSKATEYNHYEIKAKVVNDDGTLDDNPITVISCTDKTEKRAEFYLDFKKSQEYQIELLLYSDKCNGTPITLTGRVTESNNRIHLAPVDFEKIVNKLSSPKAFFSIINQEAKYSRVLIIGGADSISEPISVNHSGSYKNVSSVILNGDGTNNEVVYPEYKEELAWLSMKSILIDSINYVMGGIGTRTKTPALNKKSYTLGWNSDGVTLVDTKKEVIGKEGFAIVTNSEGAQSIPMGNLNKPTIVGNCGVNNFCDTGYECNNDKCELIDHCTVAGECPTGYRCAQVEEKCINNDKSLVTVNFNTETSTFDSLEFIDYPGDLTQIDKFATYTRYTDDNDNGALYEIISGGINENGTISDKVLIYKNCLNDRAGCTPITTTKKLEIPRYGHSVYIDKNNTIWVMGGIVNCDDRVKEVKIDDKIKEIGDEQGSNNCSNDLIVTKSIEIMTLNQDF